jgi:hypothetical protein
MAGIDGRVKMKRSEMVELILSKMRHLDLGTDSGDTYYISEFTEATYSHASQLLEFIEELGMLPPTIKVKETRSGYNQFGEQSGTYTTLYDRNQWEPEE